MTQPTISRIIKQLEDDIGQALLTRNYRDVTPTDVGKVLYDRASQILREVAALDAEIADLVEVKRGSVSLGLPPLSGTLFVPFIKRFKERYPNIDLQLHEKGSKATERAFALSEIEIGTLIMPVDPILYDHIRIAEARLVLAANLNSPWASRQQVELSELKDEMFILFPHEFALNDSIVAACRKAGFDLKVASRSSHAQLILGLVESGVGVALLPSSVIPENSKVAIIPLAPLIEWNIALAWPKRSYLSIASRALISLAKEKGLSPDFSPPK